jgi:AGZA family xanthine/uracil permease-like MFS transporter
MAGATVLAVLLKLVLKAPGSSGASQGLAASMLVQRFQIANAVVASPPSLAPTFLKLDLVHALSIKMLPLIFVFLFMLVFDAIAR